jgi:hypothetical protein
MGVIYNILSRCFQFTFHHAVNVFAMSSEFLEQKGSENKYLNLTKKVILPTNEKLNIETIKKKLLKF